MSIRYRLAVVLLLLAPLAAWAQPLVEPILLDTAIGDDIDEAFGLAYALSADINIGLRGITTVGDHAEDRAWIVCRFLTQSESRKIPVAAGAEPQPKLGIDWQIQYRRHPAPIFNRTQKPEKTTAVEWLAQHLKEYERGTIAILATGPSPTSPGSSKSTPKPSRGSSVSSGSPANGT